MLYYLFQYLNDFDFPGAGLFDYISFRAAMALITSLIVSMVFGKRLIGLLQKQQIGETVRDLGLEGQLAKQGTPTSSPTTKLCLRRRRPSTIASGRDSTHRSRRAWERSKLRTRRGLKRRS